MLLERLAALGDLARLRMLRLLSKEDLSVGELSRIMQLPQSTVSRHLKLLHEGGWLFKRSEGTASIYRLDEANLDQSARQLWQVAAAQLDSGAAFDHDDARLVEVLASRRLDTHSFFGKIGGEWDDLRRDLFGTEFTTEALLALIDERWTIADLGCGTGNVAALLAPLVKNVIAVDREPAMLKATRKRLSAFGNVELRKGELTNLPIESNTMDAAIVSLVLHHLPDPGEAVREIARTLKPSTGRAKAATGGGTLLIIDMIAHDREIYRQSMGHVHLGFDETVVRSWAIGGKLSFVRYHRLRPDTSGKGPALFAATFRRH
jgi:SAM-dependent methyltransferase